LKKYAIPLILLAVVLVAGIFALTPVYQASTVHTTIGTDIDAQDRGISWIVEGVSTTTVIPAKAGIAIKGTVVVSNMAGAGTCNVNDTVGPDGITATATGGATGSQDIEAGVTTDFGTGEGIIIDVVGSATCNVTLFIDSMAG